MWTVRPAEAHRGKPRLNADELQAERAKELTVLAGVLSVDALRARRAFGRRTRDELSARRDDNSLVRGFLRDLSFLFLLRGHCESAYQLYKKRLHVSAKKVLLQRFAEVAKRRTAFSFPRFQVPKFSFSEKGDVFKFSFKR